MKNLFALLMLVVVVAGCASKTPEEFTQDKPLFEHAMSLYDKGRYTDAIPFFESVRNRFPGSRYAVDADLRLADSHYEKEDYIAAESSYVMFRSLHPTHREIPYVVFRIGMTHFKRVPGGIDRDQTHTERALTMFQDFVNRYPNADEVDEANGHITTLKRMLADREMYVANFYLKQKQYKAALIRLESLRGNTDFQDLKVEATYKLGYAYYKLEDKIQAETFLSEVVENPDAGRYRKRAQSLLSKAKAM